MNIQNLFSVKKITYFSILILSISSYLIIAALLNLYKITKFNESITNGETSQFFSQSFESRFSTAYWLAEKGMFKESTILFNNLLQETDEEQKSAVQHNIGNIFFLRGLAISGTSMDARPEAEYLLRQAKKSYVQSIKASNAHWDTKHNLDRLLTMLPSDPTPGVGDSDSPGLIMGNIPVGLP